MPPLRVRPSDVLDLSRYFVRLLSKQQGVRLALTPEAERQLLAYNYPNNVVVSSLQPATQPPAVRCECGDVQLPSACLLATPP